MLQIFVHEVPSSYSVFSTFEKYIHEVEKCECDGLDSKDHNLPLVDWAIYILSRPIYVLSIP